MLSGGQRLQGLIGLHVRRLLVEERVVAGCARRIRPRPREARANCRRRASGRRSRCGRPASRWNQCTTSPSRNCCAGVQQDLSPGQRGLHPHQVHGVLELVAEAVGAAGLVETAAGPDPLRQRLVLEPIQVVIECAAARSRTRDGIHQAQPPAPAFLRDWPGRRPRRRYLRITPRPAAGRRPGRAPRPPALAARREHPASSEGRDGPIGPRSRRGLRPRPCSTTAGGGRRPAAMPKKRPRAVSTRSAATDMATKAGPLRKLVAGILEEQRRRATSVNCTIVKRTRHAPAEPASTIWK